MELDKNFAMINPPKSRICTYLKPRMMYFTIYKFVKNQKTPLMVGDFLIAPRGKMVISLCNEFGNTIMSLGNDQNDFGSEG